MYEYVIGAAALVAGYKTYRLVRRYKVSKNPPPIIKGAEPYLYTDKKNKIGILLLHGFSSNVGDLGDLGQKIFNKGFNVGAPLMKGHGRTPEYMATTNDEDWYRSCEKGYLELKKHCEHVYLLGFSFGGNVAIRLAANYPVRGVIGIGVPIYFIHRYVMRLGAPILGLFKDFKKKDHYKYLDKDTIKKRLTYDRIPLNNIKHLLRTVKISKKLLPNIKCPFLIVQSDTDHLLTENNVDYIYDHLGSDLKEKLVLHNTYHVPVHPDSQKTTFEAVYEFINKVQTG